MSTIFGVFRRDGRPVEPDDLLSMGRAVTFLGSVPAAYWRGTEIGLGVCRRHPEDSWSDPQPLQDATTGITISAHVRLDNRGELCDQLGIAADGQTDTELILAAYLKWGEEFVPRLLGDWAIAIWDSRSRKLLLSRDHHGMTPMFY